MMLNAKKSLRVWFLPAFIAGVLTTYFLANLSCCALAILFASVYYLHGRIVATVVLLLSVAGAVSMYHVLPATIGNESVAIDVQYVGSLTPLQTFGHGTVVRLQGHVYSQYLKEQKRQLVTDALIDTSVMHRVKRSEVVQADLHVMFREGQVSCRVQQIIPIQQEPSLRNEMHVSVQEMVQELFREDFSGIVYALITGNRESIPEATLQEFKLTGTMHLLAVSGLHTGLVCLFAWFACAPFPRLRPWCTLVIVLTFAWFTNTPSCWRASSMFCVWLLAKQFGRLADSLSLFSFAIVGICVVHPESILSPAFHLSVLAVGSMLLILPRMQELTRKASTFLRMLIMSAAVSASASSLVTVYLAAIGAPVNGLSLIVNMIVVPTFSFGIVCTYVAILIPTGPLASLYATSAEFAFELSAWLNQLGMRAEFVCWQSEAVVLAVCISACTMSLLYVRTLRGVGVALLLTILASVVLAPMFRNVRMQQAGVLRNNAKETTVYVRETRTLVVFSHFSKQDVRPISRQLPDARRLQRAIDVSYLTPDDSLQYVLTNDGSVLAKIRQHLTHDATIVVEGAPNSWYLFRSLDWCREHRPRVQVHRLIH